MLNDTREFLADMASEVLFVPPGTDPTEPITALGILDTGSNQLSIGGVDISTDEPALTFATADLPGIDSNLQITVAGVNYLVRNVTPELDGVFSKALLKKA
jgi:hypothetical protein